MSNRRGFLLLATLLSLGCASAQPATRPVPPAAPQPGAGGVGPAGQGAGQAPGGGGGGPGANAGPRPYERVITRAAVSDSGLFLVHRVEARHYFEIPDSLLGRDLLFLSRIAQAPQDLSGFLNAGSNTGQQVVRWERQGNRILLRGISYRYVADDTLPIAYSVRTNTLSPILRSFRIEAFGRDSAAYVVDVTGFFEEDTPMLNGLSQAQRTQFRVRRFDPARSFVDQVRSYPLNVEVKHTQTYDAAQPPALQSGATITIQMQQSMVLLPAEPMRPRHADPRVGWFSINQIDFSLPEYKAGERTLIRRWRLEPRDPAAYARGELVEPIKPIVFYIDPGTPHEWRAWIKRGVEDWQPAFEAAGFRNAIVARDPPSRAEDPEFDMDDVRYNSVRYIANMTRNATGPSVSDPRTGEIIESDIIWYHNHLRSYRNRLMVETGAANPAARSLKMDMALIGETVRQVIAHEIGHALGLPHNMTASSAFPVDSLRSPSFTSRYGVAATIMDYARQNYVAQPGDGVTRFIRGIGPYDHYAINWGYRNIPNSTPESERATLDGWIRERADDPRYRFEASGIDPRTQTEDIGDDPVRASGYGIANLKRVVPNLVAWTTTPGQDYTDLEEIYGELVSSWSRYVGHTITNVGGVYQTTKASDQAGPVYQPVPAARQRATLQFLREQVFAPPTWLVPEDLLRRLEPTGAVNRVRQAQAGVLNQLLSPSRLLRMLEHEAYRGAAAGYRVTDLLGDLRSGIWTELGGSGAIDSWRRVVQREHLNRLVLLLAEPPPPPAGPATPASQAAAQLRAELAASDVRPLVRAELVALGAAIRGRLGRTGHPVTRAHLAEAESRIRATLEPGR
jgi:hypothetical protein